MSVEERNSIAQKLTQTGLFPQKGVEIVRWDSTPDGWGVLIAEATTAADMDMALNMWRAAGTGFFNHTQTSVATPIQEAIPRMAELLNILKSQ